MRFKMSGTPATALLSPLVMYFVNGDVFHPAPYIAQGYNTFDVICVGAAGGSAGVAGSTGWGGRRVFGGAGGGGGLHRAQGLLSSLPSNTQVFVGSKGSDGASIAAAIAGVTDGSDGGYSSFNGNTCRASGGTGGKKPTGTVASTAVGGDGGVGGIGGRTTAGGGAASQADGTWNGVIGSGGGGGKGANLSLTPNAQGYYGSSGLAGVGNYDANDTSVYGPKQVNPPHPFSPTPPYSGGGAKAFPIDGSNQVWGGWEDTQLGFGSGIVVVKLSQS